MEEEQVAVPGEATPAPSASETEAVSEVETSEVGTSDQPTQETTGAEEAPKPSRAQERIRELSKEANYWKDLALQAAPLEEKSTPTDESEGVGIDDIAKAVVRELEGKENSKRVEAAQKAAIQDALQAAAEFPELDRDERLSRRVLAIAQADDISITEAARYLFGSTRKEQRVAADQALKSGASAPQGAKVSSGSPEVKDIWSLPPEQRKAHWGDYVRQLAEQQGEQ